MKKYICIVFGITILACARDVNKVKSEAVEEAAETNYEFMIEVGDEEAKDVIIENISTEEEMNFKEDREDSPDLFSPSTPLVQLTEQKLKEYFDLIQLKQEHPEFKDDIILQLQKFSNDTTIGESYAKNFKLENVRIAKYLGHNTDSIKTLKLYFDVVQNQFKRKDSIYATINERQTVIDNQQTTSYKIKFSKVLN